MEASALRADGAAGWVRVVSGGQPLRSGQSDVEFFHVLLAERVRDVGPQPVVDAFVIGERVVLVVGLPGRPLQTRMSRRVMSSASVLAT